MIDWVTIEKFSDDVGMTKAAISKNATKKGSWPEDMVWIKLEGRIFISRSGWDTWLETERASRKRQKTAFKLSSSTKESGVERESSLSPQLPILTG